MNDETLYAELGHAWRQFISWREKIFAGYLTVLAALGIAFAQGSSVPLRSGIFAGAVVVSVVFWILDFRNRQMIGACQTAAAALEQQKGAYSALNRLRFDRVTRVTHGLGINLLVGGVVGASCGGLYIYLARWWAGDFNVVAIVVAAAMASAVPWLLEWLGDRQRAAEDKASNGSG